MEVKKNMTTIIKEEKRIIIQNDFDSMIIPIFDVSRFPMPGELYFSEKDLAW